MLAEFAIELITFSDSDTSTFLLPQGLLLLQLNT